MQTFRTAAERARIQSSALDFCAALDRWRVQLRWVERARGLNDAETKRRAFRWELAAFRLKSGLLRYVGLDEKAGFRRDQPRDDRGRWTYLGDIPIRAPGPMGEAGIVVAQAGFGTLIAEIPRGRGRDCVYKFGSFSVVAPGPANFRCPARVPWSAVTHGRLLNDN